MSSALPGQVEQSGRHGRVFVEGPAAAKVLAVSVG